ncbi:MAG TPA: arginine--tRNA ligase, partial [Longimicrobium sp.]|nr:arginine--tRNA ligase [Longimicrobium sp.]
HWFRETEEQRYIDAFVEEQAARGALAADAEGRRVVELEGGPVPLLRSDGSTLYMSHMVAAILQRAEFLGPRADVLMSLTGQEQIPAFAQLGEILRRFGYADRVEVRHAWHGLVTEGGEKMASRDGAAPTLDGVYAALCDEVAARVPAALAPAFARGALRLYLLGRPARRPLDFSLVRCAAEGGAMVADVARTLRATAEGEGREEAEDGPPPRALPQALGEWRMRLAAYPAVVDRATRELDPALLVRWLADVCGGFCALHRALRGADGAVPAELGRLHLPLRRTVDHALGLLDAREVEYEMLPVERGAAPARRARAAAPAGAAA